MKKNLIKICIVMISSAAILSSCSSEKNEASTVQPKAASQQASLTEQQIQDIRTQADQIVKESLATLKKPVSSKSNQRDAYSYEVLGTDIVGKSGCTFSLSSYIRSYSILDATGQSIYTSSFCAQPGHLRYGVIYYISNSGSYSTVGGITGPVGGCMSGSVTYSVNVSSPTDGFAEIVVFDVLTTGPSSGPVYVNNLYSNPRHLDCFGSSY